VFAELVQDAHLYDWIVYDAMAWTPFSRSFKLYDDARESAVRMQRSCYSAAGERLSSSSIFSRKISWRKR
jgi:hypothetical protein